MALRWVGNRSGRLLFAYGGICAFISMWISNTATCAMMFPIGLGIIATAADLTPDGPESPSIRRSSGSARP